MFKILDHRVHLGTLVLTEVPWQYVSEDTWNGSALLVRTSCTLATVLFRSWPILPSMMVSAAEAIVPTSSRKNLHMLVSTLVLTRLMVAKPSSITRDLGDSSTTTVQRSQYHHLTWPTRNSLLLLPSQVQVLVDLQLMELLQRRRLHLLRSQLHLRVVWIRTTGLAITPRSSDFRLKPERQISWLSRNTNRGCRNNWK